MHGGVIFLPPYIRGGRSLPVRIKMWMSSGEKRAFFHENPRFSIYSAALLLLPRYGGYEARGFSPFFRKREEFSTSEKGYPQYSRGYPQPARKRAEEGSPSIPHMWDFQSRSVEISSPFAAALDSSISSMSSRKESRACTRS